MKTNYIFINQVTGPLFIDMLNSYSENDCEIILYTGQIESISTELDQKIKIRFLKKYKRNSIIQRINSWIIFYLQSQYFLFIDKKIDPILFLVSNPPFAPFLNLFFSLKSYILIYDIYPDALCSLQFINSKSFLYKLFARFNKKSFNKAIMIFTIGDLMKKTLKKYVTEDKIKVVPCWADNDFIKPIPKSENIFIEKYNLQEKTIVMYSGNLGLTHDIESILEAARIMRNTISVYFVIIGDGAKKQFVLDFVNTHKLENILVLPFQDPEMFRFSSIAADISIVTVESNGLSYSIPSKTYYFLSASSAIIGLTDKESELANLIIKYDVGKVVTPGNPILLSNEIYQYLNNSKLLQFHQENGLKTSKFFTKSNAKNFFQQTQANNL